MKSTQALIITLIVATAAIFLTVGNTNGWFVIPEGTLCALRWLGVGCIAAYTAFFKNSLSAWIFVALLAGVELGNDFPLVAQNLDVVSKVFMKLIKTIIAPLLFATLVVGIAGHSNLKQVGRMGLKAIIYFEIATTVALFIGLAAINLTQAGRGLSSKAPAQPKPDTLITAQMVFMKQPDKTLKVFQIQDAVTDSTGKVLIPAGKPVELSLDAPPAKPKQDWKDIILHTFPENIAKSIAEGQVLEIVVFSILFAIGLSMVREPHKRVMIEFCESLSEVMFKFTNIVMYLAPFAVGCAIAYTVGSKGLGVMSNLLSLVGTLYVSLIVFVLLVFLPVAMLIKLPLKKFFNAVREPATIAFATASSEAALPKALENMEKFGVPRKIVSFVIPTGYSFNLDGTTLYLAMASVFVAQAANIELSLGQQIGMMLTLMLTSKGVAGIRGASLVILTGTASQWGLPEWPIVGLIMGVDAFMDMARTSVNLVGNCLATAVVARWEGELNVTPDE